MELSDLRIFKTVVEEGGVIRAARKLHGVQSSVTSRIQHLEASIGAQLFYRDRRRLVLSPKGEALLECGSAGGHSADRRGFKIATY